MRKALILTRNFPPCVTDGASRVWKLASNLVSIGWEPVVVAPPEVRGVPAVLKSGANPVSEVYRTGPVIEPGEIDPFARNELLWGGTVQFRNPSFSERLSSLFRGVSDGEAWSNRAALLVEELLATNPDIDLLYAQGPPLEPLRLAIDVARAHSLAVVLDITEPLDPEMSRPGTSALSVSSRAEQDVVLSGLPLLTPNRTLKEYFLKKYPGRLDNERVTIVPPVFDSSHPAFRWQGTKKMDTVLRIALQVDELSRGGIKTLVSGLDAWIRADGLLTGGVEIMLSGPGASALAGRAAKKPLEKLLTLDVHGGIDAELEHCRNAGFFCAVMGVSPVHTIKVPERLIEALGMGTPVSLIAPEGVASRLVLEAGGMWGQQGDAGGIMELFRGMASAWSSGSFEKTPDYLRQAHSVGEVMQALTGAIVSQPVY